MWLQYTQTTGKQVIEQKLGQWGRMLYKSENTLNGSRTPYRKSWQTPRRRKTASNGSREVCKGMDVSHHWWDKTSTGVANANS